MIVGWITSVRITCEDLRIIQFFVVFYVTITDYDHFIVGYMDSRREKTNENEKIHNYLQWKLLIVGRLGDFLPVYLIFRHLSIGVRSYTRSAEQSTKNCLVEFWNVSAHAGLNSDEHRWHCRAPPILILILTFRPKINILMHSNGSYRISASWFVTVLINTLLHA